MQKAGEGANVQYHLAATYQIKNISISKQSKMGQLIYVCHHLTDLRPNYVHVFARVLIQILYLIAYRLAYGIKGLTMKLQNN